MKNITQIDTDRYNIYITLTVKTDLIGKIFAIGLNIFLTALIIFILSKVEFTDSSKILISITIILLYYFPIKYLLWNFFGKEIIIINTKSISYSFDYGFIKTNLTTKKINKLELGYEVGNIEKEQEQGYMIFYNYQKDNNLPEILYKTNVMLDTEKLDSIELEIRRLYENEFNEKFNNIIFSQN